MTQSRGPFAAGSIDRAPRRSTETYRPVQPAPSVAPRPFWGAVERRAEGENRLADRVAREETIIQGALWDRHGQIEALLGRPVPRSMMMSGQDAANGAGELADADYEARIDAMRAEFPEQLSGIETREEMISRLSGDPIITRYDTAEGPAWVYTAANGSVVLETASGRSGPLSSFPGARPVRRTSEERGPVPLDRYGSMAGPRERSLGERFTSTAADMANTNPVMAGARWLFSRGEAFEEIEDPANPGETFRYARLGQQVIDHERERRDSYRLMAEADQWNGGDASFLHKLARGAVTLGGAFTGSAADPTSLIAPGRTAVGRVVGSMGVNAALDGVAQAADVGTGIEDEYRPLQTVAAAALGGLVQGGAELGVVAGRAVADRISGNPGGVVGEMAREIDAGSLALQRQPLSVPEPPPAVRAALARIDRERLDAARVGPLPGNEHDSAVQALDALRIPPQPAVEREIEDLMGMPPARQETAPASSYEAGRIQNMRDALASGRMRNGLDVDDETRALFQAEIAAFESRNASVVDRTDEPASDQSDGLAARPPADGGGPPDAGRMSGAGEAEPPAARDDGHIDQGHADLARLAETGDAELAAALSARISNFLDWDDVQLSRADRAAVNARQPVSADAMMIAARNYREAGVGSSMYDPDSYPDAMASERAASPNPAVGRGDTGPRGAARSEAIYQGRRMTAGTFDPMTVEADPARFQYKDAGDEGLTDRLSGVTSWDRTAAGRTILYEDRDGRTFIADGHQRRGLARRLIETGQDPSVRLDGFLFRQADGWTVADVRTIAALKNIREASGTILDAAKVFRDAPALINDRSLPITGDLIANARALSRLADEAFGAVANGVIPDRYGAEIGNLSADRPDLHMSMVDLIRQGEPRNIDEARALVQEAKLADFAATSGLQDDLFGGVPAQSTLIARARLRAAVLRQLRGDARLFASLIRNADAIEAGGNALARSSNEARVAQDMAASAAIDRLSLRVGQVGDTFGAAASAITRGDLSIAQATRQIVDEMRVSARTADAADLDRAARLDPSRPGETTLLDLQQFEAPAGRGQEAQAQPKPEDADSEARASLLWDDLPEVGQEQKALDVLRVCAPAKV